MLLAVAASAFQNQNKEEIILKYTRAVGGLDIAFAELTGGNVAMIANDLVEISRGRISGTSTPVFPSASSSLKLNDLKAFFAVFSPSVPPGLVEKLAAAVEPTCVVTGLAGPQPTLSLEAWRTLLLLFGRLRVASKSGSDAAARLEADWGEDKGPYANVGARLLRSCLGREVVLNSAPLTAAAAAIEDCEWFDGDSVGGGGGSSSNNNNSLNLSSAAVNWAAGSTAVANPLAGAVKTGEDGGEDGDQLPPSIRIPPSSAEPSSPSDKLQGWGESDKTGSRGGGGPPLSLTHTSLRNLLTSGNILHSCARCGLSLPPINPTLPPGAGPFRSGAAAILSSPYANAFFDVTILVYIIIEFAVLNTADGSLENTLTNLEITLVAIFLAEFALKNIVWGPVAYLRSSLAHKLDMLVIVVGVVLFGLEQGVILERESALAILYLRSFRLTRYLFIIPGFGSTAAATVDLLPQLLRYLTVVISVMYFFAILGMQLFAGRLDKKKWPAVEKTSYGQNEMEGLLNFDSLISSMVLLFYQMLMNDWPIIMEGLNASFQNTWSRAYFVLYIIVVVAVVVNVV